ncbi:TetR family transcriptional regulator C-terminal domain-containing protein [Klebsiella pneumoniae]|uniref:TetR/AcrR family transcriptional regulator n=1 Tax=Klebsiella pneumoniae TaxID=573 RepID=UPI003B589F2F
MNPNTSTVLKPRRGRPPKVDRQFDDTRQALIRSGLEVLTETGYLAAGIDAVIKNIAVPKGSFYHCFKSKEAFGLAVLAAYGDFFAHKLDKFLLDDAVPPLERMAAFVRHAGQGMEKFQFRRGCLVGNLLQEAPLLPETFPQRLMAILAAWESRVARGHGPEARPPGRTPPHPPPPPGARGVGGRGGPRAAPPAAAAGAIASDASPQALAQVFWIGWEGAVMRARLVQSAAPLNQYWDFFAHSMTTKTPAQDGASADNPLPTRNTLS